MLSSGLVLLLRYMPDLNLILLRYIPDGGLASDLRDSLMVLSGHQVLIQVFSIPDDLGDGGGYSDGINDDNGSCYGKGTPSESCPATGWARYYVIEVLVFLMILVTVMVNGGEANASYHSKSVSA